MVAGYLFDALSESNYHVWAASLPYPRGQYYRNAQEAVAHFLVKKYGWTLDYCRSLKPGDIETLLLGEVDFQEIPADLQKVFDEAFEMIELFQCPARERAEFQAMRDAEKRERRKKNP
jgi:hypothetical protein